jgi:hypothetical protein
MTYEIKRMIPTSYILTTTHTKDRAVKCSEALSKLGLLYKIWEGIFGTNIRLDTGFRAFSQTTPNIGWRAGGGQLSLIINHMLLLESIKKLTNDDEFLVLEDDCFFVDNFVEEYEKSRACLPENWKVAYLSDKYFSHLIGERVNDRVCKDIPLCTHAILYHRRGIDDILDILHNDWAYSLQIDSMLIRGIKERNIPAYTFSPGLALQMSMEELSKHEKENWDKLEWPTTLSGKCQDGLDKKEDIFRIELNILSTAETLRKCLYNPQWFGLPRTFSNDKSIYALLKHLSKKISTMIFGKKAGMPYRLDEEPNFDIIKNIHGDIIDGN